MNSPLFSVVISEGTGENIVYHGHNSDLPWVILCELQDNYLIYDWSKHSWKSIDYDNFIRYRGAYHFLLLQTGITKSEWIETPITARPSEAINNSAAIKSKKAPRQRDRIALHAMASHSMSEDFSRFVDTDDLAEEIPSDLKLAHDIFTENW